MHFRLRTLSRGDKKLSVYIVVRCAWGTCLSPGSFVALSLSNTTDASQYWKPVDLQNVLWECHSEIQEMIRADGATGKHSSPSFYLALLRNVRDMAQIIPDLE